MYNNLISIFVFVSNPSGEFSLYNVFLKSAGIEIGFVVKYTFKGNINPESIIENVLVGVIKNKEYNMSLDDLMDIINSFGN